jgi:hypothetical protein
MRAIMVFIITLLTAGVAWADSFPSPIERAGNGKRQCYAPDPNHKSCEQIGAYAHNAAGGLVSLNATLISTDPLVIMRTATPLVIKGGQVCGVVRASGVREASFSVDGRPADVHQAGALRRLAASALSASLGHEFCESVSGDGDVQTSQISVDGVRRPDLDRPVLWFSANDDYEVGP